MIDSQTLGPQWGVDPVKSLLPRGINLDMGNGNFWNGGAGITSGMPAMKPQMKSLSGNYYNNAVSAQQVAGVADSIGAVLGFAENINMAGKRYSDMVFQQPDQRGERGMMPSLSGYGRLVSQTAGIDPSKAGKGLVGQGALTGMKLGATVGSFLPGFGTAIGAGVGAVAGTIAGLFGKKNASNKAEEAQQKGILAMNEAQDTINTQVQDYYTGVGQQRQNIQADRAYQQRVYGLGNFNSPFASIV